MVKRSKVSHVISLLQDSRVTHCLCVCVCSICSNEYDAPSSVWHPNFPAENVAGGDEQKGAYGVGGAHRRTDGGSMLATTSVGHEHDESLVHLDSDDDELVWEDLELQG